MKKKLDEKTLEAYIRQAINEELGERFLGIPSRKDLNQKWGYQWNDNLTRQQNKALRNLNKANIKAGGYRNAQEFEAGEGYAYGQPPQPQEEPETQQAPEQTYPEVYPYKNDRQKTGQFQTWFNLPPEQGGMGGNLVVDGIWGQKTQAAYQQWLNSVSN
jgi:hypothetical protein